jgi:hypothetical protein
MTINRENTNIGKRFEREVLKDIQSRFPIEVTTNIVLKEIGIEFDLVSYFKDRTEYIEAKGGECNDNKGGGALRTDNVKKAIASGALLKTIKPDCKYIIYFSFPPKVNNRSDIMLKSAIAAGYVDEVRILQYSFNPKNLESFFS